jgi:hypothetical protein
VHGRPWCGQKNKIAQPWCKTMGWRTKLNKT